MNRLSALLLVLALAWGAPAAAQSPRPEGAEGAVHREQVWRLPHNADEGREIAAIVFRPPGDGPRPLVVMTHHTSGDAARNGEPRHGVYPHVVSWFVERGYVVAVVHRRGYGLTGGERAERFACRRPNHFAAGRADAADLAAAIDGLTGLPFVRKDGVVAVGQSTGGWAAAALAVENHPAVAGTINFGGGRRGRSGETGQTCALDELVRDARFMGRRARTPALWLYTENDQSFPPDLTRRMAEAYRAAGGTLDFQLLAPFGRDGHALLPNPGGIPVWGPLVERFILKFR
ncbi:dienelactone hydrolase family protein [Phreatobacter cathodiphilus]|uniref:Dipeptidyl aminopeptidase n=1 Tax=Phreatobacter cathodiphilus TaxID=1868589 RepID=A0A2S0NEW4_9HYPH|nr:dienelactone hydrolase family protein [Phreatobacter cathodiphilus]AVO46576.1 dipeptidyl aminopeptidase [Phreatobacter cathodiphilus]